MVTDCVVVASASGVRTIPLPPTTPGTVCERTIFTPSMPDPPLAITATSLAPTVMGRLNEAGLEKTALPAPPITSSAVVPGMVELALPVAVAVLGEPKQLSVKVVPSWMVASTTVSALTAGDPAAVGQRKATAYFVVPLGTANVTWLLGAALVKEPAPTWVATTTGMGPVNVTVTVVPLPIAGMLPLPPQPLTARAKPQLTTLITARRACIGSPFVLARNIHCSECYRTCIGAKR